MFSSKSRPAPSKATLKLLYQLAYVSSGTAAGLATLCAEERRRQTAIVQKIADNAKRIRQSPRYRHHAARAKETSAESSVEQSQHDDEEGEQHLTIMMRRKKSGEEGSRNRFAHFRAGMPDRDVRAPELPSAVERGYQQLVEKNTKRKRRRKPGFQDDPNDSMASKDTEERTARQSGQFPLMPGHVEHAGPPPNPFRKPLAKRSTHLNQQLVPQCDTAMDPHTLLRTYILKSQDMARLETNSAAAQKALHARPKFRTQELDRIINPMSEHQHQSSEASDTDVVQDAELFFESVPWMNDLKLEATIEQTRAASKLLELASRAGLLGETRSLCHWKLSRDLMDEEDFRVVCQNFGSLTHKAESEDYEDIHTLFMDLFGSSNYESLSAEFRAWALVQAVAGVLTWTIDTALRTKWAQLLAMKGSKLEYEVLAKELEALCDHLIQQKGIDRAGILLYIMRSRSANAFPELVARILKEANARGNMYTVQLLLKQSFGFGFARGNERQAILRSTYTDANLFPELEDHVYRCVQKKAVRFLLPLVTQLSLLDRYGVNKPYRWIDKVNDRTKCDIAVACMHCEPFPQSLFDRFYKAIPDDQRQAVDEAFAVHRLRQVWFSTYDLQAVWKHYDAIKSPHARVPRQPVFGALETTLMEICDIAGQPRRGMSLVKSLKNPDGSLDSVSLSLAAVTLASSSAWQKLKDLLEVAAASNEFVNDKFTTKRLNHVIRSYAEKHTATQVWKFVFTDLIKGIGFRPSRQTTRVLLWAFVQKKAFALIPAWLRYIRSTDGAFSFSPKAMAALMRSFWVKYRPPHVLLMWLCRNLWEQAPSIRPRHFRSLLQASISYDLRYLDTQMTAGLRRLAHGNLELVDAMREEMPMPMTRNEPRVVKFGQSQEVLGSEAQSTAADMEHDTKLVSQQLSSIEAQGAVDDYDAPVPPTYQPTIRYIPTSDNDVTSKNTKQRNAQVTVPASNSNDDGYDAESSALKPVSEQPDRSVADNSYLDALPLTNRPQVQTTLSKPLASSNDKHGDTDQDGVSWHSDGDDDEYHADSSALQTMSEQPDWSIADNDFLDALYSTNSAQVQTTLSKPLASSNDKHSDIDQDGVKQVAYLGATERDAAGVSLAAPVEFLDSLSKADPLETFDDETHSNDAGNGIIEKENDRPLSTAELVQDMIAAYSSKDYQRTVDLYHQSLTPNGLPLTPRALEVAVEARVKLDDESLDGAKTMMREAQEAGYNVTSAFGPLLIHEFRQLPVQERQDANALRVKIIDYYRTNDENGWVMGHYFGTTAARELIKVGRAQYAINLLNAIYTSEWVQHRPLDIVTMTVYLQAYGSLKHQSGLIWTVRTVLASGMRIDRIFIKTLGQVAKALSQTGPDDVDAKGCASLLMDLREDCIERRLDQRTNALYSGQRLVTVLASCWNATQASDTVWSELENGGAFSLPAEAYEVVKLASMGDEDVDGVPLWRKERRMRRHRRLRYPMKLFMRSETLDDGFAEMDIDAARKERLRQTYERTWMEQLVAVGLREAPQLNDGAEAEAEAEAAAAAALPARDDSFGPPEAYCE